VGDVIGKKIIPQSQPSLLAGGIVVQTAQASAIPSKLQHKFTYSLYASPTTKGMALLTYTEKTSKLVASA
jgi:hypothetical protein